MQPTEHHQEVVAVAHFPEGVHGAAVVHDGDWALYVICVAGEGVDGGLREAGSTQPLCTVTLAPDHHATTRRHTNSELALYSDRLEIRNGWRFVNTHTYLNTHTVDSSAFTPHSVAAICDKYAPGSGKELPAEDQRVVAYVLCSSRDSAKRHEFEEDRLQILHAAGQPAPIDARLLDEASMRGPAAFVSNALFRLEPCPRGGHMVPDPRLVESNHPQLWTATRTGAALLEVASSAVHHLYGEMAGIVRTHGLSAHSFRETKEAAGDRAALTSGVMSIAGKILEIEQQVAVCLAGQFAQNRHTQFHFPCPQEHAEALRGLSDAAGGIVHVPFLAEKTAPRLGEEAGAQAQAVKRPRHNAQIRPAEHVLSHYTRKVGNLPRTVGEHAMVSGVVASETDHPTWPPRIDALHGPFVPGKPPAPTRPHRYTADGTERVYEEMPEYAPTNPHSAPPFCVAGGTTGESFSLPFKRPAKDARTNTLPGPLLGIVFTLETEGSSSVRGLNSAAPAMFQGAFARTRIVPQSLAQRVGGEEAAASHEEGTLRTCDGKTDHIVLERHALTQEELSRAQHYLEAHVPPMASMVFLADDPTGRLQVDRVNRPLALPVPPGHRAQIAGRHNAHPTGGHNYHVGAHGFVVSASANDRLHLTRRYSAAQVLKEFPEVHAAAADALEAYRECAPLVASIRKKTGVRTLGDGPQTTVDTLGDQWVPYLEDARTNLAKRKPNALDDPEGYFGLQATNTILSAKATLDERLAQAAQSKTLFGLEPCAASLQSTLGAVYDARVVNDSHEAGHREVVAVHHDDQAAAAEFGARRWPDVKVLFVDPRHGTDHEFASRDAAMDSANLRRASSVREALGLRDDNTLRFREIQPMAHCVMRGGNQNGSKASHTAHFRVHYSSERLASEDNPKGRGVVDVHVGTLNSLGHNEPSAGRIPRTIVGDGSDSVKTRYNPSWTLHISRHHAHDEV